MKLKVIACFLLSLFLVGSGVALGSSQFGIFQGKQIVHITNNGNTLTTADVPAYIDEGRAMVPLYLLRQAGMQVTWSGSDYTVDIKQAHQFTQAEIDQFSKSVAKIQVFDSADQLIGQASGFIVDGGTYGKLLLTNCHVGCSGPTMRVEINGELITVKDRPLFQNAKTDVYGVQITTNAPALQYKKDISLLGTNILVIGYPKGNYKFGSSWIGAVTENDGVTRLSHGPEMDSGASGGLVVDDSGQAISIFTGGWTKTNNVSTPTYYIQQELDKLH